MSKRRIGRRPWGPEQERLHPRDDRGRFSRVGGRNWAGRVLQAAHSGALGDLGHPGMRPERLGMFRSHDDRHGARLGRGPAGVIDTQTFRTKVRENLQLKRDIEEYQQRQGGKFTPLRQVTTGDEVRPDPAKDEWFKVNAMGFGGATGDYIEYADLSGRQHRITGDKMVMVRKPPEFEPYKAATAQQQADLDRWQADAAKAPPFRIVRPTRGEERRADYLRYAEENDVTAKAERAKVVQEARKRIPAGYYGDAAYEKRARREYVDDQMRYNVYVLSAKHYRELAADPTVQPGDDQPGYLSAHAEFTGTLDPARPLAVYGDLLHAYDNSQASHRHLQELSRIPAELHQIVAGEMAMHRARKEGEETPGVYVGGVPVSELDGLGRLKGEKPRGWRENSTFDEVDGVFSGGVLASGHTAAADRKGDSSAGHEFGHALDWALARIATRKGRFVGEMSADEDFTALHDRVRVNHGPGISPYYLQEGQAGRSEFFAESFEQWAFSMARSKHAGRDGVTAGFMAGQSLRRRFDLTNDQLLADLHTYYLALTKQAGVDWGEAGR
jgi:hypothetical protein